MYTVCDFINAKIEPKHMKFGWRVEILPPAGLSCQPEIALRFTMLNFDWHSLDYINDELWNMFLSSESYRGMKEKMERARTKHGRLYFSAYSIECLKEMLEDENIMVDIDRLIDRAVKRKSERIHAKMDREVKIENGEV